MTLANVKLCFDEIRSTVLDWLSDLLPVEVVELEQGTPRPNPPFLGFKLDTAMESIGVYDEQNFRGDIFKMTGHRTFMMSFEAVSEHRDFSNKPRATDILTEIQFDMDNPLTTQIFRAVGLSVVDKGNILDITKILETDYEPRAALDARFGLALEKIIQMPDIGTTTITGELDSNLGGNPDHTIPITVNEP